MSIRMTKSTWRGENDVESSPEGSEQVEEIQERHGSHHINKSLSVDHLERAFAEVSLMEKYDCKKVVLDISAHQHLKKTSHDGHSPSETSEVKQEPCIKEPQEKQEEDTAERCEERKASSEKVVESKGEVGEQKKCDEIINKNEEKYLTSIPVGDEDEDEDELSDDESDEEDHGPLITVKLEDIVKDKTEAPYLKQGPNEIGSVHMPYSTNTPKILLEPLKEISGKDKSPLQISKEVRHGPQKETVEERDVKEGDKVGVIDREEKNNKLMSKDEERSFSSADEDVPDDEESSDEEDQVAIITVKLEDVKDDTDEAYLERGPSKGGNVQMRYSPLTPKSHGYSIHGSHGLQPHSSSITAAGLYPSSHMSCSPRYGISAGPYNSAVTPAYQSAGSSGSLAALPPLFETTTISPASFGNVSPQRELTTALPLSSHTNKPTFYEGTPALSPGSYTSGSPFYEGTPALSPGSYNSASPIYEGTSALSPGSYTNTSPLYDGAYVSPGSYNCASPGYEGTPALSQGSCTNTSPLYEGMYDVSPMSYASASPLYEGTTAQSPGLYRSTSPSYEGIGKAGPQTNLYIDGSVAVTPAPAFVHTSGDPLSPPASDTSSLHDDLEAHTDSLNYANLSGGLIGEHLPEISTPYMTPPHQAVQPTQVYGHIFGQHNSIEEVLEVRHSVITQVDVGEVEPDVGEVEPHYVEQILKDLQTLDGGEFEDLPGLNDTNFDSFSDEHQSPYPAAPRVNHRVGKHSSGYKDIKPKTQPKILSIPQQEMQRHMCKTSLEQICRKMTTMGIDNTRALYHVESDGETCLTRILKRHSDSDNFYENIYALQEILKRIQMCCDTRVDRQQCSKCGQRNPEEFYTPLSVCNMEGKCGLTIAVEKNHPPEVVNYLCSGIEECRKDLQRAFNQQARQIFAHNITSYPVFGRFLSNL
ncbi:uncharacterized protein LOC143039325 isoform X2 [Oratosquilla oratoria]|uniref:uncharacterized protein LOC143039325 isoform X2 n=1 Tax=Oratosquilla oratoria TaxID=337810 RepID=UPI003F765FE8